MFPHSHRPSDVRAVAFSAYESRDDASDSQPRGLQPGPENHAEPLLLSHRGQPRGFRWQKPAAGFVGDTRGHTDSRAALPGLDELCETGVPRNLLPPGLSAGVTCRDSRTALCRG